MSHIIQPIEIDSTDYCCKCYGTTAALGRGTKGVLTEDFLFVSTPEINTAVITNDCSPWTAMTGSFSDFTTYTPEGELSFGVSCGSEVAIDLDSSSAGGSGDDVYSCAVKIYRDGVLWDTYFLSSGSASETDTITVTGGPCGEIITIHAFNEFLIINDFTTTVTVTAEVTSIT